MTKIQFYPSYDAYIVARVWLAGSLKKDTSCGRLKIDSLHPVSFTRSDNLNQNKAYKDSVA